MRAGTDTSRCILTAAAATLIAASVAGCTSHSTKSSSPAGPGEGEPIKITLSYQPSGTAALSWDRPSENVTAKLQMGGFPPGTTYAVDIRKGSCAAIGDVALPFPEVTADSAGTISTTVTGGQPAPGGLLPGTALSVHLAVPASSGVSPALGAAPLACGDITAAVVTTTLTMAPVGQRPQGWANVTYNPDNKTLIVATGASGLAPNTTHAQHIGLGTCEAQGAVKYPLNDLAASANGTGYQTTVVLNVDQPPPSSGGWYVTVYSGPANGEPAPATAPIVCGDIGKSLSPS